MPKQEPGPWAATIIFAVLLALSLVFASCAEAQIRVYGRIEIEPTPMHTAIYEMMEACSGRDGDWRAVRWSVAKLIQRQDNSRTVPAMWTDARGEREIIFDRDEVFDGYYISHEALHDLYEGKVPMDVAQRCLLTWTKLRPVQ